MTELKRVLGFWTVLSLSIVSIMGTGMFFGVSIGSQISGNGVIIAWIALTFFSLYIAMFFGELSSMFPRAGGVYEFSKNAYGKFTSFMLGWIAWFVGNINVVLMIVAAINYLFPQQGMQLGKVVVSIALILSLNLIAFFGIEASAFVLMIFALVTFAVLFSIIFPGSQVMDPANFTPFLPAGVGITAVFITIFFLAESFFGWEATTYLAEETKNPEKNIPRALILGTLIVGVLGIALAIISLGVQRWDILAGHPAPLNPVFEAIHGAQYSRFFTIGIFVTFIGAASGGIFTLPRLILALSRDKLFITQFSSVHPKYNTPYKAILFQTIVSIIVFAMVFGKYEQLLSLTLPLSFIFYAFTISIVAKLRLTRPELNRPFKAPFATPGSITLIVIMVSLLFFWLWTTPGAPQILGLAVSFIFLGVPIYLLLEMYYDPDEIRKMHDALAYPTFLTESLVFPKSVRKELISLAGDLNGKTVFEYGCSVGTLTTHLAETIGPRGHLVGIDISPKEAEIAQKRILHKGYRNVRIIHDEHLVSRVHPQVPHVDAIVSMGMLSILQDLDRILKEMRDLLPYQGKIVFADYVDFFKLIPNVAWLSDNKEIEKVFRRNGFSVFVKRKKGMFWNYVIVYGMKYHENVPYV